MFVNQFLFFMIRNNWVSIDFCLQNVQLKIGYTFSIAYGSSRFDEGIDLGKH